MFVKVLAALASVAGSVAAVAGTQACMIIIWDEPEMPKTLIEK